MKSAANNEKHESTIVCRKSAVPAKLLFQQVYVMHFVYWRERRKL